MSPLESLARRIWKTKDDKALRIRFCRKLGGMNVDTVERFMEEDQVLELRGLVTKIMWHKLQQEEE